jgi:predicted PurR-regulated permease PerM
MINTIHPSKIYQFTMIGIIMVLGWVLWKQLSFLFPSLLGAIALYILLKEPMFWLVNKRGLKDWMATLLLILGTLVIIVIPVWLIIKLMIFKIQPILSSPEVITDILKEINTYLDDTLGLNVITQETIMKMTGRMTQFAQTILSSTVLTLLILLFMYVFLFFMLVNSRRMELFLQRNLPFKTENRDKIMHEVTRMVRSNAITIPTVAFLQGSVAFGGYWVFGLNEPVLLGVLTAMSSMIPITGASLVYIPVVIYTLATGSMVTGVGLALWCVLLVGAIDNVARFMLQKRLANVHPIITILGVIVGTKLFGLIGLVFGPLMITLFVVMVRIYFNEFGSLTGPVRQRIEQ